jgi:probable rRNA maturation factor
MKKLNFKYRGRNATTDILSFSSATRGLLGSLVIDLDTAKEQAKEYKHSLDQEIVELFIHGVLHLLGFDHEKVKDAKIMARYETSFIQADRRQKS